MPTQRNIYLNLPVADLKRSIAFFEALGFTLNPQFSDETAAGMSITDHIFMMLHTHASFARFTPGKQIADAVRDAEVLIALDAPDRADVDDMIARAVAAGGSEYRETMDMGELMSADPRRVMEKLPTMGKIDIEGLREAGA